MFETIEALIKPIMMLLSFVSGGNSFPRPLTAKEEREYLEKFSQGDKEAREKLIEHNLRLVAHIAKKYTGTVAESEDLISIGTIGLIKGISSFDAKKGARLATYAARCVENEILMLMRSKKKTQGEISLNDPIGTDKEGNQIYLIDVMKSDGGEIFEEIQTKEHIKQLYKNIKNELTDRERLIIKMRYGFIDGKDYTQHEIADKLNISRSYVSRIEKKAIKKLKKGIA
ncbi:MAG: RNA polymerase sporulation sigma factor SigK [Ruminococcaceae bacterium]|nr:RNA polymerase sporulation sigma factor SigK [Oscillospiraceae bacterium]